MLRAMTSKKKARIHNSMAKTITIAEVHELYRERLLSREMTDKSALQVMSTVMDFLKDQGVEVERPKKDVFDPKTRLIYTDLDPARIANVPWHDPVEVTPKTSRMRKVQITVTFETDADVYSLQDLEMNMRAQAESLYDGTISNHFKVESLHSDLDCNYN
jgi:hypothetical protein